jgi:hypothetical protein
MVPKEVKVAVDINTDTIPTARMWTAVLAPEGLVGLAIEASVRVYTRADEEI